MSDIKGIIQQRIERLMRGGAKVLYGRLPAPVDHLRAAWAATEATLLLARYVEAGEVALADLDDDLLAGAVAVRYERGTPPPIER